MLQLVTDALEVVGLILLAVALGVFLARFDLSLGLTGAAFMLLGESVLLTFLAGRGGDR